MPALTALLLVSAVAWAGIPTPAFAQSVEPRLVSRFVTLSDRFQARVPQSDVARLSADQREQRAVCILSRFRDAHGDAGVRALMNLMDVLSRGADFDDPGIVAFNDRYGPDFNRTETECTRRAGTS